MLDVSTKESRAKFYASTEWKKLRQQALERDHFECVWCKENGKVSDWSNSILEVDHIQELEYHPELAMEISNLRTLCKDCHNKRHNRMNYRSNNKNKNRWAEDEWW